MKRRDRVMECTIAAIAGIGIAAILTASLGVRSSGESTPLKSGAATVAAPSTVADTRAKPSRAASKHQAKKRHVHRRHRRHARVSTAPAAPAAPVVAQAAPVATQRPVRSTPVRTQPVAPPPTPAPQPKPAPKPTPVKAPSRPKPSGVSFDDSG